MVTHIYNELMPSPTIKRRQPAQRRSQQTVGAILDAVIKIIKRRGVAGVTTNHIAEAAGVSIGSVYQYFPNKRAIFVALHDRHVDQIAGVIERTLVRHAASPLDEIVQALIEALIDAHSDDPELHELLTTEVPHGATSTSSLDVRLRGALRLAISANSNQRHTSAQLDRILFIVPIMVEALSHGAALRRPARLSLAAARREAVRAVLVYLHS
jgi:AcrR family transcriptional regulator